MNEMQQYQRWLTATLTNAELQEELTQIRDDAAAIEDRFYRELEFGTGGLRGVLGAGTNRMNVYTVAKATQGYSNYLKQGKEDPSVAIGHDSRIHSDDFARTAAAVFAANGIQVYLYSRLMPTPALSFAVRDLHCDGGVVITASHNPAKYNGYKVYGADGCQITTEAAKAIQQAIDGVDPFDDVRQQAFDAAVQAGRIQYIGKDTVDRYQAAVATASVLPEGIDKNVAIVYTPLNGAGISCVPRCLQENGFTNIIIPDEQKDPDGNFPTCPYPNPEVKEALEVGLRWAEKMQSDLLLATDPDCDRVGAAVKDGTGYTLINGNQMGVLLLDFICKMRRQNGTMPQAPVAVKTIVTTPMAKRVADHYGVQLIDVLTGFKFIGEQIGLLEQKGEADRYVFGFEESYGYLSGSFVRDKDAVNGSLLICEMFAWYKAQGKSLVDVLDELYEQFGYFESKLLSFQFEGADGFAKMQDLMRGLRENSPAEIAELQVEQVIDYQNDETGLPRSNVVRFLLHGGAEAVVRPSGTEPKLKVYLTALGQGRQEAADTTERLERFVNEWIGK